jgi:hypothetical protein
MDKKNPHPPSSSSAFIVFYDIIHGEKEGGEKRNAMTK